MSRRTDLGRAAAQSGAARAPHVSLATLTPDAFDRLVDEVTEDCVKAAIRTLAEAEIPDPAAARALQPAIRACVVGALVTAYAGTDNGPHQAREQKGGH